MRKNAWVICCCTAVLSAFGIFFRWLQNQACFEAETGLAPDRLLFVDDRADNIAAAAARGWQTHLFDGPDGWAARLAGLGLLPDAGRKAG